MWSRRIMLDKLIGILLLFASLCTSTPQLEDKFRQSLDRVLSTPRSLVDESFIPDELAVLQPYFRHLNLKYPKPLPPGARDALCSACIVGIEALIDAIKLGASIETVEQAALVLCDIFHIEDHEV